MNMSYFKVCVLTVMIAFANHGCKSQNKLRALDTDQTASSEVILEIITESKYMVYPPGTVTNIKLFSSGRAEYDYYPNQGSDAQFKLERRAVMLDKSEVSEVASLVNQLGAITVKPEYAPTVPILDASIVTRVMYTKNKEVGVVILKENHSNLILENKKGIYPQPLLDLLIFVQNFDQKMLRVG